jgi:chromatin modification-related protein VID21
VHDTHAQFTKMPYMSPMELAKRKMEKDAQMQAERRAAEQTQRQLRQQQLLGSVRARPRARAHR